MATITSRNWSISLANSGVRIRARRDLPLLAILLSLVAHLLFSFIDASTKWFTLAGFPVLQIVFMRYFGHFAISLAVVSRQSGLRRAFSSPRPVLTLVRGSMLAIGTTCNFFAIGYLPLSLTSTFLFLSPLMICAASWPVLGERVGPWRIAAIAIGFVGILIVVRPFGETFHPAVLLSLASVTAYSVYLLLTRVLAGVVGADTLQLYSGAVGAFAFLPVIPLIWQSPETAFGWALLLGIGVWGYLGHEALTRAYEVGEAALLAPFAYSFLIYMNLWSAFAFGEPPDGWAIVGMGVVTVAGLLIWARERVAFRDRAGAGIMPKPGP